MLSIRVEEDVVSMKLPETSIKSTCVQRSDKLALFSHSTGKAKSVTVTQAPLTQVIAPPETSVKVPDGPVVLYCSLKFLAELVALAYIEEETLIFL